MKRIINTIMTLCVAFGLSACHEPEYIMPDENATFGIISLKAVFPDGPYADQVLATLNVTDPEQDVYTIQIPWYYPITSDDLTLTYMTDLRIKATLAPNFRLEPALGKLDLTEENKFTLYGPDGYSKKIVINGERVLPDMCDLVTFVIKDVMVDGIPDPDKKTVLIPTEDDLSAVHVYGQVSPHASISMVGNEPWDENKTFNFNGEQTVTVLAANGESKGVYTVKKGTPKLIDYGLDPASFKELFNLDPVSVLGLPAASEPACVSLAGIGSNIVVCVGGGREPLLVNRFDGAKAGTMKLGAAVADVIAGDEGEHVLLANYAADNETVNLYRSDDPKEDPVLFGSFVNPLDNTSGFGIGHRMKIIGNLDTEAVITFTSEGIVDKTVANRAVYLHVKNGAIDGDPKIVSFAFNNVAGWDKAPDLLATVVPASITPEADGWYVDFYSGNVDPSVADGGEYILHYFNRNGKDNYVDHCGNWANNPNCLDSKQFNHGSFMALFIVSHFPNWGISPMLRFYDISDPGSPAPVAVVNELNWAQKGDYPADGASGDVCLCPSKDGYRLFLYYYDHMAQSFGAFVADCIQK